MKKINQFGAFSVCLASSGKFVVRQDRKTIATHHHAFDAEQDAKARNNAEWDAMAKMLREMKKGAWAMNIQLGVTASGGFAVVDADNAPVGFGATPTEAFEDFMSQIPDEAWAMSHIIHFNQMDVEVSQHGANLWTAREANYDYDRPMGYGSTMMEAIADLREQLEESEWR
jgi:hypothetical protein